MISGLCTRGPRQARPKYLILAALVLLAAAPTATASFTHSVEGYACVRGDADTDAGDVSRATCLIVADGCVDGRAAYALPVAAAVRGARYCNAALTEVMR